MTVLYMKRFDSKFVHQSNERKSENHNSWRCYNNWNLCSSKIRKFSEYKSMLGIFYVTPSWDGWIVHNICRSIVGMAFINTEITTKYAWLTDCNISCCDFNKFLSMKCIMISVQERIVAIDRLCQLDCVCMCVCMLLA